MPRIRVEDYDNFDDDQDLNIENDDPTDRLGNKLPLPKNYKQNKDWEEQQKRLQKRKFRDYD